MEWKSQYDSQMPVPPVGIQARIRGTESQVRFKRVLPPSLTQTKGIEGIYDEIGRLLFAMGKKINGHNEASLSLKREILALELDSKR
jgi:hypothetical protein